MPIWCLRETSASDMSLMLSVNTLWITTGEYKEVCRRPQTASLQLLLTALTFTVFSDWSAHVKILISHYRPFSDILEALHHNCPLQREGPDLRSVKQLIILGICFCVSIIIVVVLSPCHYDQILVHQISSQNISYFLINGHPWLHDMSLFISIWYFLIILFTGEQSIQILYQKERTIMNRLWNS